MLERPQRVVPGFEDEDDMTVCSDWPKTKNGAPPSAQSAIFNPLLACAITGPIEGFCSANELAVAIEWWSKVFPAWPRWVSELRIAAGIIDNDDINNEHRKKLLRCAKGQSNPLIHRCQGWGTENRSPSVPHFKGQDQNDILELAPMVAIEVYAAVTICYSNTKKRPLE